MLSKSLIVQSLVWRNAGALSRAYHQGHHRVSTMNDLPVPQGDWHEANSQRQSKYNAALAIGVLMLATSIGLAKSTGLIELNASPPSTYE